MNLTFYIGDASYPCAGYCLTRLPYGAEYLTIHLAPAAADSVQSALEGAGTISFSDGVQFDGRWAVDSTEREVGGADMTLILRRKDADET